MAKKQDLPLDIPNLGRWLAQDPEARLSRLRTVVLRASKKDYPRIAERARIALKIAWDARPDRVFGLTKTWVTGKEVRLRRLVAGSLPLSSLEFHDQALKLSRKFADDPDPGVRYQAIDHICEAINEHLDLAERWLKDPDPEVRAIVARRLRGLSTDLIKPRIELFHPLARDPHPEVAWALASTLAELYEREPRPVIETMRLLATSEHETMRAAAAACFFEHVFADSFDQLLPTMRAWLRTGEPNLRWTLVRSLRFIGLTPRSMQLIRGLYEEPEPKIRARLVQSMIDLFDPAEEASGMLVPLLVRASQDTYKVVREAAALGSERYGEEFDLALEQVGA
jgi:HEAT repeat protein